MTEPFLPTAEGAEAVVRAARRRRQAKLSGVGSSAVAVLVGVVALHGSGPGGRAPDQLITSNTSTPTAVATESVGPATPAPSGSTVSAGPVGASQGPVVPGQTPSPGAVSPQPTEPRTTSRAASPITRTKVASMAATDLCPDATTTVADTWCVTEVVPSTIKRGHTAVLGLTVCLQPAQPAQTVRFTSTRQAQIDVSSQFGDGVIWQGGEGLRFTQPGPTLTFQPGDCYRWTSPWDTRDRDGFLVPPGTYDLADGLEGVVDGVGTTITVSE